MSTQLAENLVPTHEPFATARIHAAKVEATLSSDEMIRKPHTDVEELCAQQGREWSRLMLEEHMRLRAQLERRVDVQGADGVERRSVRDSERQLETVLGTVPVPRMAYQAAGSQDLHSLSLPLAPQLAGGVQPPQSTAVAQPSEANPHEAPTCAQVLGAHMLVPHLLAPPPPQTLPAGHVPHSTLPPHSSGDEPHSAPSCEHVLGAQTPASVEPSAASGSAPSGNTVPSGNGPSTLASPPAVPEEPPVP
jgi:hypothetical protein